MSRHANATLRLGRTPNMTTNHNIETWEKISKFLEVAGRATYEDIASLCLAHEPGTKADLGLPANRIAERFVDYCIKNGWLVRS